MKYLIIILTVVMLMTGLNSCVVRPVPRPHRAFVIPEHRTRHHWGAPRRQSTHDRYWGRHKYGPRPHPYRGHYR